MHHPVLAVNILFFLNVTVGFWLIGLVQRTFWLIDPYWTLAPVMIAYFYREHPLTLHNQQSLDTPLQHHDIRAGLALLLLWIWAIRLTHSYFRREQWKFGQQEDWRYTDMARNQGDLVWTFVSFFAVGLAQQPLLTGLTLPLYSTHFSTNKGDSSLSALDALALVMCVAGLTCAKFADDELRNYMADNEEREARGQPRLSLLYRGIWRYSRHPNYFGEQCFWWGLALFSVRLGDTWAVMGTFLNSIVLAIVTVMTEQRMLKNWSPARAELYRKYRATTSCWIPMPPCGDVQPLIEASKPKTT